jgi:predicted nucleotidyltransferase
MQSYAAWIGAGLAPKLTGMSDDRTAATGGADVIEANLPAVRELCRRFGVRRLDLFGSAATGRFNPSRSDLDFLVQFEETTPSGFAGGYFGLLKALETLFARKIDLLTEEGLQNPYRRRRIESEKRTLYQAP